MVRPFATAAALLLLLLPGGSAHEAVLSDDLRDDPPGQKLPNIAALIKDLKLCFLQPPMAPLKLSVPVVGDIEIDKICCKDSTVAGMGLKMQAIDPEIMWVGDTAFDFQLMQLSSHCVADWAYGDWKGQVTMGLGTAGNADASPFIQIGVKMSGVPISAHGTQYPWPGQVTQTTCAVDFELSDVAFSGEMPSWVRAILNAGASMATLFQGLFRPLVCPLVKIKVPSMLDKVLTQVRDTAAPYIQTVAEDADPPEKPAGSGEAYDLRAVKALSWFHSLARQGLETNGINRLAQRVTSGKDAVKVMMGKNGLQVAKLNVSVPADVDLGVWIVNAGLEGVGTIEQLDIAPDDATTVNINLGQKHLNVSTKIRTTTSTKDSAGPGGLALLFEHFVGGHDDDVIRNITKVLAGATEYLIENFELRLFLADVRLNARAGVFWDVNQSEYLAPSSSWYLNQCLPTMIQNASITHMGLTVVVNEFRFDSDVASKEQLEKDFDNCVNSVLGYLNTPQMRPTVSRLVQSIAAGPARDIGNQVFQQLLTTPPAQPCVAEDGFGWWPGFYGLLGLGFFLILLAFGSLISWWWSKRLHKIGRRFSALLAAGGMLLLPGATLGHPFGAVIRMHNGDASGGWTGQDLIVNMYVLEITDLLKYMPGTVIVIAVSTLMWGSRMMAVMGLAVWNPSEGGARLAKFVRVMGALAGWDLGMMYMLCVTQVVSFYARILEFGSTWIDMGVALRPAFYLLPVCFFFSDVASVLVYKSCKASKFDLVKYEEPPSRVVLVCLLLSLMVLVLAPGFTLWTHTYGGVAGEVIHFQYGTGVKREVSLWSVIVNAPQWLADPAELGIGVYIVMALIAINMVLAPIVNAALSLYVGVRLRQYGTDHFHSRRASMTGVRSEPTGDGRRGACRDIECSAEPRRSCSPDSVQASGSGVPAPEHYDISTFGGGSAPNLSKGQTSQSFESGPQCGGGVGSGAAIPRGISEGSFDTAVPSLTHDASGRGLGQHRGIDRLAWALVVARTWSGADAFAVYMAIIVPELGNQLMFMSIQACDPLKDAMGQIGVECNTLSSQLNIGLLFLFLASFSSRILSELAAHGPLRGLPTWEKQAARSPLLVGASF